MGVAADGGARRLWWCVAAGRLLFVERGRVRLGCRFRGELLAPIVRPCCYPGEMFNLQCSVSSLSSADLLARTRDLARKSQNVEADLLVHLAEIDARKLYAEWAFSSMFEFCVKDLGFSEDAAFNRIFVARAGRSLPAMFDALRSGRVHLFGLRLLAPHLTGENHEEILARAAGKSKREIE